MTVGDSSDVDTIIDVVCAVLDSTIVDNSAVIDAGTLLDSTDEVWVTMDVGDGADSAAVVDSAVAVSVTDRNSDDVISDLRVADEVSVPAE